MSRRHASSEAGLRYSGVPGDSCRSRYRGFVISVRQARSSLRHVMLPFSEVPPRSSSSQRHGTHSVYIEICASAKESAAFVKTCEYCPDQR